MKNPDLQFQQDIKVHKGPPATAKPSKADKSVGKRMAHQLSAKLRKGID